MKMWKLWQWKQITIAWTLFTILQMLINRVLCLKDLKISVPEAVADGDTVTLSCQYDLENDALYLVRWYLDSEEFYRYVPKEEPPARVFEIAGVSVDIKKSDANNVTIRSLTRNQTGTYQCEVSADAPLFHTEHQSAKMMVATLPDSQPAVSVFGVTTDPTGRRVVQQGERFKASCISGPSYPPVNFTWRINGVKYPSSTSGVRDTGIIRSWDTRETYSEILVNVDNVLSRSHSSHQNQLFVIHPHPRRSLHLRCETNIFTLYRGAAEVELEVMEDHPPTYGGKVSPTTDQRGGANRGDPDNSALTGSAILLGGYHKCFIFRLILFCL
ncbi:uncharacterized protein LOC129787696 [Lutzomyia longipalpis]|uniref:uncharacterized protein LOC129787696 n=1 Tax=Lutzomyia longipalpis TaxID=7200 RepID=UPI002483D486|nr:uncharacterized protein LOC129787696 [Lutzomyia longipalpis]XP_055679404.1 uncharacterized protein LOC129787696 [Lutzomyia longipalpis]